MTDLVALLHDRMAELGIDGLQIPPPVFVDMQAEVLDYVEGSALTVRFPVLERYQNPMGSMQGGVTAAAIDNVLGPLSYLVAPPSVTTQLSVQYLRPINAGTPYIDVEGRLIERAGTYLHFQARVTNPRGKPVALAQATTQIVRTRRS
jgi:uncharacterized protein (TIGR00369 family)